MTSTRDTDEGAMLHLLEALSVPTSAEPNAAFTHQSIRKNFLQQMDVLEFHPTPRPTPPMRKKKPEEQPSAASNKPVMS
ncbi:hypothetical protein PHYSODRAFT_355902 [Phytophthora sojae]|uniref:Uncharacterized protein n=1 Tax=Phytophthora sojae (strain P6497) TaxID=1094619 RepID=G5A6H5_PHYSP|nr:hypothetical protein PHYSODRAFT_355902 [Phytophthora sojae]EGZ08930.1 hypothetical protein PHYSODRAFT_355902 [Phytophthora sojae]|eukprot:XP_009535563.1 hypothetical protein PHYSODRAFT_355902 [Phytophthora sojae]